MIGAFSHEQVSSCSRHLWLVARSCKLFFVHEGCATWRYFSRTSGETSHPHLQVASLKLHFTAFEVQRALSTSADLGCSPLSDAALGHRHPWLSCPSLETALHDCSAQYGESMGRSIGPRRISVTFISLQRPGRFADGNSFLGQHQTVLLLMIYVSIVGGLRIAQAVVVNHPPPLHRTDWRCACLDLAGSGSR